MTLNSANEVAQLIARQRVGLREIGLSDVRQANESERTAIAAIEKARRSEVNADGKSKAIAVPSVSEEAPKRPDEQMPVSREQMPSSPLPPVPPVPPASGDRLYDDGMDATRLDKLETFADATKERLARIETTLDHIKSEVSSVKWWIVAQIAAGLFTVVVTVVGTGIAIQQMTVATFQGAAQVAKDSAPAVSAPAQQQPIIINVPAAAVSPSK